MRIISYIAFLFLLTTSLIAGPQKILVEVFTNSHCPLCPAAHSTIDSYLQNGNNKSNVVYIYYHMTFPYPDDQLNLANTADASSRNNFYGTFSSTPRGIFNGQVQANNYSVWGSLLDGLNGDSQFDLSLKGTLNGNNLTFTTNIKQNNSVNSSNLALYVVAVENVFYQGRNGISNHSNVMRKMFPTADGRAIVNQPNQTQEITETFSLDQAWTKSNLGFIVFIQDKQTRTVYQTEYITYNNLITTSISDSEDVLPETFSLEQNYPNPFNPTTTISYSLAYDGFVTLKVFDVLGNEVATLVNNFQTAGNYNAQFLASLNARRSGSNINSQLNSGIYFYTLKVIVNGRRDFVATKKMLLLK